MEMRALGSSGLKVSLVGLGCNNFGGRVDLEGSRQTVHRALDLGINLLDTADSYSNRGGSESALGQILGTRRKAVVLATKFGMPMDDAQSMMGASRRYIVSAVEASLQRLKTDWIDLYQIHKPDPKTPIEETLRALDDLVRQGKVRSIGCSNFSAAQLDEAQATSARHSLAAFVSSQDEYSLLVRDIERDILPTIRKHKVGLLPFFPLASGLLTGKYTRGKPLPEGTRFTRTQVFNERFLTDANWDKVERLREFCAKRKRSMLELAFSWLAAQPGVASVIAGATRPEQIDQNVGAVGWKLSEADLKELARP